VAYRVEWEKVQQREKAKMDEIAEKERVAYAQVDWHDFVVVETVDYQPNEIGLFRRIKSLNAQTDDANAKTV
jgi:splicing factor 3A subunit 1